MWGFALRLLIILRFAVIGFQPGWMDFARGVIVVGRVIARRVMIERMILGRMVICCVIVVGRSSSWLSSDA